MKRRHDLSDVKWAQIEPLLPGRVGAPGRSGKDNRRFVDAIVWIAKAGVPWRDLPERFGNWNSVVQRYNRWCKRGVWQRVFEILDGDPDLEHLLLDSTIVRAHQHAAGAKGGARNEAIGRSRGGWSTKVHAAVNGSGQPVRSSTTGGEWHNVMEAETLLEDLSLEYVIGGKGYDSDPLRKKIRRHGAKPVIPGRKGIRRRRYCPDRSLPESRAAGAPNTTADV